MPVVTNDSDSISHTLLALDSGVDPLWLRHLPRTEDTTDPSDSNSARMVTLGTSSRSGFPHLHDVLGWRRWLQQKDIQEVRCYLPGRKSWALLSAAILRSIPISLYVTQRLEPGDLNYLKLWKKRTHRFYCAATSIRRQLLDHDVPAEMITEDAPEISFSPTSDVDLAHDKNQLQIHDQELIFLAMVSPQDHKSLRDIVWTAAIVEHACPGIRLILAGTTSDKDRMRVTDWETMFKTESMVMVYSTSQAWDMALQICDVVLAGDSAGKEMLRLLYAQAAQKPILAAGTCHNEFLEGYEKAVLVDPPTPRQFAATILDRIQVYSQG